jgi:UDPglucose 6-dehydrogenase
LKTTSELSEAVTDADFVFTCVPTPQDEDGSADLSYVISASAAMSNFLKPGAVVVTKSTVPVGSAQIVEDAIGRSDVEVASNPEFLREGSAVYDFRNPDRIVVGARSTKVAQSVLDLYSKIDCPKVLTSQATAELIKYASNSCMAWVLIPELETVSLNLVQVGAAPVFQRTPKLLNRLHAHLALICH